MTNSMLAKKEGR